MDGRSARLDLLTYPASVTLPAFAPRWTTEILSILSLEAATIPAVWCWGWAGSTVALQTVLSPSILYVKFLNCLTPTPVISPWDKVPSTERLIDRAA